MCESITSSDLSTLPATLDTSRASELTGHSQHWVTDMCARGRIKAVRVGGRWRINTAALLKQLGLDE